MTGVQTCALPIWDIGTEIDAAGLSAALGVPVVPMVASDQQGLPDLRAQLIEHAARSRATGTAGTPSQPARSLLELPQRFGELVPAALDTACGIEQRAIHIEDDGANAPLGDQSHDGRLVVGETEPRMQSGKRCRRPPVPASRDPHQRRHEERANDACVEEDGEGDAESHQLHR